MEVETIEKLKRVIIECNPKEAAILAKKAMDEKIDPIEALNALTETIRQVGDRFARGELWLPELVGSADAMQTAIPIIEEELKRSKAKREALGTVVIGAVFGDVHSIGKNIVSTLLAVNGFRVIDLGINISGEQFVEAVKEHKSDLLAMSALLTITAIEQKKVIDLLEEEGLRGKVKIMVGGGAVTEKFARDIGADGYDATAIGAVGLARRLLGM
jgi:corrinoid protein of di/trimethylamine methyltransferase